MSDDKTGKTSDKGGDNRKPTARMSARKSRLHRYGIWVGPLLLVVIGLAGFAYVNYKIFRDEPQITCGDVEEANKEDLCASEAEEWFKYGSLDRKSTRLNSSH